MKLSTMLYLNPQLENKMLQYWKITGMYLNKSDLLTGLIVPL